MMLLIPDHSDDIGLPKGLTVKGESETEAYGRQEVYDLAVIEDEEDADMAQELYFDGDVMFPSLEDDDDPV